jgi:DNA-binding GntR family transcriptional regulator
VLSMHLYRIHSVVVRLMHGAKRNGVKPKMTSAERVTMRLAVEIVTGSLPAGMHLDEKSQSMRLGVSRTPLREALSYLSALGLADSRPNHGVHVAEDAGPALLAAALHDLASLGVRAVLPRLDLARRLDFAGSIRDGRDWLEMFHQECSNSITGRISRSLWRIMLAADEGRQDGPETQPVRDRLAQAVIDLDFEAAAAAMQHYVDLRLQTGAGWLDS